MRPAIGDLIPLEKTLPVIKNIQHGSVQPFNNALTIYSHLITAVDELKSIVMINYMPSSPFSYADDIMISSKVRSDGLAIEFEREGNGEACSSIVKYTVIEFEDVKSKQSGMESVEGYTTDIVTVNSVDVNKSILVCTKRTSVTGISSLRDLAIEYEITSPTSINIRNTSSSFSYFEWQLIEFN